MRHRCQPSESARRPTLGPFVAALSTSLFLPADVAASLSFVGVWRAGLGKDELGRVIAALLKGLDDYTSDQRGDVGSWIRLACLRGCAELVRSILAEPQPGTWLTVDEYRDVLGKMLKLAVERIDGVRRGAGEALEKIVLLDAATVNADGPAKGFSLPGAAVLHGLFAPR